MALQVDLNDPGEFWKDHPVKVGCILVIPVSKPGEDGAEMNAEWAIFVQETHYSEEGCWVKARFLGGSDAWSRADGIQAISRERQLVHLCRGGLVRCAEARKKGVHVTFSQSCHQAHQGPSL